MSELDKDLNDIIHKMSNIRINDDRTSSLEKITEESDMAPPGSVRGNLMTPIEIFSDEEQKKIDRRNFIIRVKTIALDTLNYKPLTDPRSLTKREFNKVVSVCQEIIDKMSISDINYKFDNIVCNTILSEDSDITRYPVYSNTIFR